MEEMIKRMRRNQYQIAAAYEGYAKNKLIAGLCIGMFVGFLIGCYVMHLYMNVS